MHQVEIASALFQVIDVYKQHSKIEKIYLIGMQHPTKVGFSIFRENVPADGYYYYHLLIILGAGQKNTLAAISPKIDRLISPNLEYNYLCWTISELNQKMREGHLTTHLLNKSKCPVLHDAGLIAIDPPGVYDVRDIYGKVELEANLLLKRSKYFRDRARYFEKEERFAASAWLLHHCVLHTLRAVLYKATGEPFHHVDKLSTLIHACDGYCGLKREKFTNRIGKKLDEIDHYMNLTMTYVLSNKDYYKLLGGVLYLLASVRKIFINMPKPYN